MERVSFFNPVTGKDIDVTAPATVGGLSVVAGGSFSRPADTTAYASGDLVANSTTAGSVVPIAVAAGRAALLSTTTGASGQIRRVRLSTSKTGLAGTEVFRVHFFKTAPTSTAGDNAAFASAVNGIAAIHIGYCDVTMDRPFSDGTKGLGVPSVGSEITFDTALNSANIYALIEARGAYTPASGETFTLACETLQD